MRTEPSSAQKFPLKNDRAAPDDLVGRLVDDDDGVVGVGAR